MLQLRKMLINPQIFSCSIRNVAAHSLVLIEKLTFKFSFVMNCGCSFKDDNGWNWKFHICIQEHLLIYSNIWQVCHYASSNLCIHNLLTEQVLTSPHLESLFFFSLQMVIPGDVAEMTEFQEKTMNNSRFIVELCLPNVQLVLPSKAFYEKLHNRYKIAEWQ